MTADQYIYEVYKERSFSKAAKNLYVSQPALSAAVKKAETELGITIFDRSSTPMLLTEEGKVYIEYIEKIMHIEEERKNILSDIGELKRGKLTVSGENFVSSFVMPKIILEFNKKYPGVEIELVESNSPDLRQYLLNESIDLLVAHDFNQALYTSEPLFDETMLLAVPEKFEINKSLCEYILTMEDIENGKHLKSDCPKLKLSKFKQEKFLLLKKGNDSRRRAEILFEEENFKPDKVVIYLDQLITSYNMACAGLGVAFVTDIVVKSSKNTGCVFYKLSGRSTHRSMAIGYKKNKYRSKAMSAFIETAKEVYKR